MRKNEKPVGLVAIPIERIAFGIRYQRRYEVMDRVGAIVDRILHSSGTPFGPSKFPYINREPELHVLLNPDTKEELRLTESDAILEMKIDSRKTSDIKTLAEHYAAFVLDALRDIARLSSIVRYGVLFRLQECHSSLQETPAEHFIKPDFQDTRSLSLRFTRRLAVMEALARKNVNDYKNVIYTVKQTEEGKVKIWIDYQEYFSPELNSKEWSQRPFTNFVDHGIEYFLGEFQGWLRTLTKKTEAA